MEFFVGDIVSIIEKRSYYVTCPMCLGKKEITVNNITVCCPHCGDSETEPSGEKLFTEEEPTTLVGTISLKNIGEGREDYWVHIPERNGYEGMSFYFSKKDFQKRITLVKRSENPLIPKFNIGDTVSCEKGTGIIVACVSSIIKTSVFPLGGNSIQYTIKKFSKRPMSKSDSYMSLYFRINENDLTRI